MASHNELGKQGEEMALAYLVEKGYKILHCNWQRNSLKGINTNSSLLDESFISLLLEKGLTEFDIKQVLKKYSPNIKIENQFEKNTIYEQIPELKSKPEQTFEWFNKYMAP